MLVSEQPLQQCVDPGVLAKQIVVVHREAASGGERLDRLMTPDRWTRPHRVHRVRCQRAHERGRLQVAPLRQWSKLIVSVPARFRASMAMANEDHAHDHSRHRDRHKQNLAHGTEQRHDRSMQNIDEPQALAQVTDRLAARFPDLALDTVRTVIEGEHRKLDGRPVRNYVPVLVERAAREALTTIAADSRVLA